MNIRAKVFGHGLAESPVVRVKHPKGAIADMLGSIPVLRQHGRSADTRLEQRFLLGREPTRVSRDGGTCDVQLINLCGGGAMIAASFAPALFEQFELHVGRHGTIHCCVLWIKNGRIGLEFAEETRLDCAQDAQAALLREVIQRHFPEARFEAPLPVAAVPNEEHRRDPRHPFIWSGTLHCEFGSTPVRVRNISADGAMIETALALSPGSEPYLDLGEAGAVFGTIVWKAGDHAGLAFHQTFDLTALAHARPQLTGDCGSLVRFGPGGSGRGH